jgi:hypothetical protein
VSDCWTALTILFVCLHARICSSNKNTFIALASNAMETVLRMQAGERQIPGKLCCQNPSTKFSFLMGELSAGYDHPDRYYEMGSAPRILGAVNAAQQMNQMEIRSELIHGSSNVY